ncbi:MAG TPA: hypothetical protein VGF45_14325, partial [Polyangia bacterium]
NGAQAQTSPVTSEIEEQVKDTIGGTDTPGPTSTEINPFEALGRYEAATTNRNISQIKHELAVRLAFKPDANESNTARAIRMCVIGRLKKRLGHNDAYDYLTQAIELDPIEPGFELWAGEYWTGARGSKRPVTERTERHFSRGLEKLKNIKKAGKHKEYHDIVESWIHKQLIVLYQQDGQPILPWKAYPQRGISGLYAPGLSLQSMFQVSADTRDFWFNNEMRIFTAEAAWASSDLRGRGPLKQITDREIYDIARAPIRWQADNRVRLRHNWLGALDLAHSYFHSYKSQVTSYYTPSGPYNDVTVHQFGPSYERVFPLYPLVDFRLAASYRRVHRNGVIEFLQNRDISNEDFNFYEVKPSISRFLGPNKLTIEGVYADLRLPTNSAAPPGEGARRKLIRGVTFEFGLYTPLVLPTFESGSFGTYRTPTRGWYFYGGAVQDEEVYGIKTVTARAEVGVALRRGGQVRLHFAGHVLVGTHVVHQPRHGTIRRLHRARSGVLERPRPRGHSVSDHQPGRVPGDRSGRFRFGHAPPGDPHHVRQEADRPALLRERARRRRVLVEVRRQRHRRYDVSGDRRLRRPDVLQHRQMDS